MLPFIAGILTTFRANILIYGEELDGLRSRILDSHGGRRHSIGQARLQTADDCFPDILHRLSFSRPLRYAPGNRGALGDNHSGFVRFQAASMATTHDAAVAAC